MAEKPPLPPNYSKFLKLSPSVKVMTLKKSSTMFRAKEPTGSRVGIFNNPLAAGSVRPPTSPILTDTRGASTADGSIPLKPISKGRKLISIFSSKSVNKGINKQHLEKSGIGDQQDSETDVANHDKKITPEVAPKLWHGRWKHFVTDAFRSTKNQMITLPPIFPGSKEDMTAVQDLLPTRLKSTIHK